MIIDKWNSLCETKRNLEYELSKSKLAMASIESELNNVQQQLCELSSLMPKDSIEFIYEQGYGK